LAVPESSAGLAAYLLWQPKAHGRANDHDYCSFDDAEDPVSAAPYDACYPVSERRQSERGVQPSPPAPAWRSESAADYLGRQATRGLPQCRLVRLVTLDEDSLPHL